MNTLINFPDINLQKAVEKELQNLTGKSFHNHPIYQHHLFCILFLDLSFLNIKNLDGIQHCVNLRALNIYNNKISNIEMIATVN